MEYEYPSCVSFCLQIFLCSINRGQDIRTCSVDSVLFKRAHRGSVHSGDGTNFLLNRDCFNQLLLNLSFVLNVAIRRGSK